VVIIGARGFLGKALNEYLSTLGIPTVQVGSADVDLTQPQSVDQLTRLVMPEDAIVFNSALTPDKGKDRGTMLKNIMMGHHLCMFLEAANCSHLVYLSSDAVYGTSDKLLRETSCCQPDSLYGLGHWSREEMIKGAAAEKNIPLVILRPCALYGAGDTHNSYGPNRFARTAAQERQITLFGNGEEQRNHFFIGDAVEIIRRCLDHKSAGLLNLATGIPVLFMEIAEKVASLFDEPVEIRVTPRKNPITYINFDPTVLFKAFPTIGLTSLEDGLATLVNK
jgi:nucleoside-diphosphate-sugar epimerase